MAKSNTNSSKKVNLHDGLHALVNKMIEQMEEGTGQWVKSWSAPNGFPQNYITKKEYRGFNFFYLSNIMEERGYKAPYFLTFNQVKEKGGQVKKGAKSIPVYFYKMLSFNESMENVKTGEDSLVSKTVPLLREYRVFNIEDTTLEYVLPIGETNDNERFARADKFIEDTGADIRYFGNRAFYRPDSDFIQVPELPYFKSSEDFYATTLHEITHWSGSSKRLDRLKTGSFGSKDYAFEELVAELGSVFLCSHLGISIENNQHPEYLASWIQKLRDDPQVLWRAASQAQQAFDYIRGLTEDVVIEDFEGVAA